MKNQERKESGEERREKRKEKKKMNEKRENIDKQILLKNIAENRRI